MQEPSIRTSRLAIAGSLAALIIAGGGGFLLGRSTAPEPPPAATPPPRLLPKRVAAPPERALNRSDLIALGAAAADASSSGVPLPAPSVGLAGRRFELALPFGCDGPASAGSEAPMRWRYDEAASALRIHVSPVSWTKTDWWADPTASVEAMEGFWIERPWSSRETCPPSPAVAAARGADPLTLPGQTLGVVQLISADTPRQMRRNGKPYEAVIRMPAEAAQFDHGLRIRLVGRIGRFPDGQPTRCTQTGGREQRPLCLIAVTIEEVAFQNPDTEEVLSVWQPTVDAPASGGRDE